MKRTSGIVLGTVLALALAVGAGWVAVSHAGSDGTAPKAPASGTACPSAKAATGCPASMKAGGCPMATKGVCGSMEGKAASGACPGGAGAMAAIAMPEGTRMTRMDVNDGIDLIFTGKDLTAIRTAVDEHIAACTGTKDKPCGDVTCTAQNTENSVILSLRGANAETCVAMMAASIGDDGTNPPAKPAKKKGSWWKRF